MASTSDPDALDSIWDDQERTMGQLFMMGFDGTTVTPDIQRLIEKHHLGSVLLTAKNLTSAKAATKLVQALQTIAFKAGHPVPLAIAIDQENGGVNSLFDRTFIHQFPSAMAVAATGSLELARRVAKASGQEIGATGVNWIMGPVLDVLADPRSQPLGVRASGDDPDEAARYGVAAMKGYRDAGLATCGKHFPSYGNLDVLGSPSDVPVITETFEQLRTEALVPFRNAIRRGLDAMMVGGCAMSAMNIAHACLSEDVIQGLLRRSLRFDGLVLSDCLEMEALSHNIGVGGGTVMAINAGCDVVLLCGSFAGQIEAINGLKLGLDDAIISPERVRRSLRRVLDLKKSCTSWEQALNPPGINLLATLQPSHAELSLRSYEASITVVRDDQRLLPLTEVLDPEEELLLLSPLVKPLPVPTSSKSATGEAHVHSPESAGWGRQASTMSGEAVFRDLGRSLARQRSGKVSHTSYTAHGVRPAHERLIDRAGAVVVITADSNRHHYQHAFAKHVAMICQTRSTLEEGRRAKPLVVVAVSSPYDFASDGSIGTYVCTYDFTPTALEALGRVLLGQLSPVGRLPGRRRASPPPSSSRQQWLVESWQEERDASPLDDLIRAVHQARPAGTLSALVGASSDSFSLGVAEVDEAHFVVRNSSTRALYGFCASYFFRRTGTGVIGAMMVDATRRRRSIGQSMHDRAVRWLRTRDGLKRIQLGSRLPSIYLGLSIGNSVEGKRLRQWFSHLGWNISFSRRVCSMVLRDLSGWQPPDGLTAMLKSAGVDFDFVQGADQADDLLGHVKTFPRQGVAEIYELALAEPSSCGIIRAIRTQDRSTVGTVVLYTGQSRLARYVPALRLTKESTGGISSPVIAPSASDYGSLLQGLILLGIRQIKQQGLKACLLDYVDGEANIDALTEMGFEILHRFEEVNCDAKTLREMSAA